MVTTQIIFGLIALTFFAFALVFFNYRNNLSELNERFPLMRRQRESRLHPLFRTKGEVITFAVVAIVIGFIFFFIMFGVAV